MNYTTLKVKIPPFAYKKMCLTFVHPLTYITVASLANLQIDRVHVSKELVQKAIFEKKMHQFNAKMYHSLFVTKHFQTDVFGNEGDS